MPSFLILFFKRSLDFAKKHWQLFVGAGAVIVVMMVFHKRETSFVDDYKKIEQAHQQEIIKINAAHEQEVKALQENEKKLKDSLALIQKQYNDAEKELDVQKKKQVDKIVKDYGTDPTELAKQISQVTGFSIVISEQ